MEFFIILKIPENMHALGAIIKTKWIMQVLKKHSKMRWPMTCLCLPHISRAKADTVACKETQHFGMLAFCNFGILA